VLNYIMVPLDGSPLAEKALEPAMVLARRCDAEILLVRTLFDSEPPEPIRQSTRFTAAPGAQDYLDSVAAYLKGEGIVARSALLPLEPAEGIVDEARFSNVDLIVMATHGRKGLDSLLHPSITWKVFQQATAPILVCKCASDEDQARPSICLPRFMTDAGAPILVPLDGSVQAEAALPIAQELANTFGNPLLLVRAAELPYIAGSAINYPMVLAEASDWSIREADSYLKRKRVELASRGLRVDIESALGPAPQLIQDVARERRAGLLVIASHGRGWLGRLMLGSVAQSVLREVDSPVLLVRRQLSDSEAKQPPATPETREKQATR
jgi:nucleotide-binding universal stress UspA family protein